MVKISAVFADTPIEFDGTGWSELSVPAFICKAPGSEAPFANATPYTVPFLFISTDESISVGLSSSIDEIKTGGKISCSCTDCNHCYLNYSKELNEMALSTAKNVSSKLVYNALFSDKCVCDYEPLWIKRNKGEVTEEEVNDYFLNPQDHHL